MSKQPQLNGAYYGPAIPPPDSYHSHGRSRGCGCCSCIFGLIFKILVTIIVLVGIVALVFWLVLRPVNKVKFHVTDAKLTQFDLNSTTLYYNLSMNLNIRNPNKHIGIYYDKIEARGYYHDERFVTKQLPKFYQGHKNTTDLNIAFNGQNIVVLENSDLSDFNSEKSKGVYEIDLKLHLRVKFKLRGIKTHYKFKPKLKCDLKMPLTSDGKTSGSFETTKCDIDW